MFQFDRKAYEARVDWFRKARFGMFIHWGLYSIPGRGEWVRSNERMPEEDYMPFFHTFSAPDFDPKGWARAAKQAGMQYVVMTAKHHDGFCLFDSALTDFKSTTTPFGRDAVAEFKPCKRGIAGSPCERREGFAAIRLDKSVLFGNSADGSADNDRTVIEPVGEEKVRAVADDYVFFVFFFKVAYRPQKLGFAFRKHEVFCVSARLHRAIGRKRGIFGICKIHIIRHLHNYSLYIILYKYINYNKNQENFLNALTFHCLFVKIKGNKLKEISMLGYIMVFLVSMVPVIELRGAIPLGLYAYDLQIVPVTLLSIVGNLLPVPFLVLFGGKVLHWLAGFERFGKPFRKILELGEKKVEKMNKNAQRALFWGLFAFVAIPLPGTGAWTGSLIAITLGLKLKKSFPPIALGVLGAGAIIVTLFYLAPEAFMALIG